ncbi:MAG TPA: AAA family ATPase, partial [Acidimicrobiales bacterium]|nr:AAA family ATPase [Acidimicrobiales bacterium]
MVGGAETFAATQEALGIAVATRTPVFLWGEPGVGKTSIVQQTVKAYRDANGWDEQSYPFVTLIASVHDPADFGGFPSPDREAEMVRRLPVDWAVKVAGRTALVFFDEFSSATPAIQAACLRVLEEKVVGPLDLGSRVSFVLAGNPDTSGTAVWEFPPAVSRRFVHLDWAPDADYLIQGFLAGFPEVRMPRLAEIPVGEEPLGGYTRLRRTLSYDPEAIGVVTGFLAANRQAVIDVPRDAGSTGRGWPNPATWERVMLLLTACRQAGAGDLTRDLLITGSVGVGTGSEFLHYLAFDDLPATEELLADPAGFDFTDVSGDKVYVVLGSVVAAVVADNTADRWRAAWTVV